MGLSAKSRRRQQRAPHTHTQQPDSSSQQQQAPTMAEQPRKRARVDEEDNGAAVAGEPSEPGGDAEAVVAAVQDQLAALKQAADDEIIQIEIAYNKKRRPLYEKRGAALATIPGFWCTVLQKHNAVVTSGFAAEAAALAAGQGPPDLVIQARRFEGSSPEQQ